MNKGLTGIQQKIIEALIHNSNVSRRSDSYGSPVSGLTDRSLSRSIGGTSQPTVSRHLKLLRKRGIFGGLIPAIGKTGKDTTFWITRFKPLSPNQLLEELYNELKRDLINNPQVSGIYITSRGNFIHHTGTHHEMTEFCSYLETRYKLSLFNEIDHIDYAFINYVPYLQ